MTIYEDLSNYFYEIETKLCYSFKDKKNLTLAFTHRSFVNESTEVNEHNERLEFLGDSVLGLIISDYLYRYLPTTPEGELSTLRSRLVEASSCSAYVSKLDVEQYLLLGKGERMNDGRGRGSILADLFEAIIGAIYLDGGLEAAKSFLFKNFSTDIDEILKTPVNNWKALLQDYCQKNHQQTPIYKVLEESGPDHDKTFTIGVYMEEQQLGTGRGASKKEGQQAAAEDALKRLSPGNH
ncbi:MAG: ribonuclease III [Chlamydiales bacterium]|nr:ribonuclease III [Chlamydiia bacterium]MCP5508610.1 ribonuclease III [Chlamydiales bacterium]